MADVSDYASVQYRIGPGNGDWITRQQLMDEIDVWSRRGGIEGAPAITISKRMVFTMEGGADSRCGDMTVVCAVDGDCQYICQRPPGHTGLHADHEDIGQSKRGWSRSS